MSPTANSADDAASIEPFAGHWRELPSMLQHQPLSNALHGLDEFAAFASIASAPTASTARTRVLADVLGPNGNLLILRVAMNELAAPLLEW